MRALKVFIFGLMYGWFLKMAFDRIYRENHLENFQDENRSLYEYVVSLERQIESTPVQREAPPLTAEPKALPTEPASSQPDEMPVPSLGASEAGRDDLKIIKGIGPAIERKLNNAGIYTFAALSRLSPKELEEILGSQIRRLQDENDVLMQAVRLAQNTPADE